ncbi:MAG: HigA family addiction module antidote protein [Anaerolineales bacterium]|jgi:addiction module HigA family antidote|uniref:HigA family addiction module antitoxin n=1 Tax=Candidatus Villigracilis vicinus TaxID=3140679 RepID=UPI003134C4D1|nr:HigA family addiction module antidote protein [Anaerolineales bacterium]
MTDKLLSIHPGEVLLEEFIKPMNLSQNRLAIDIGVDARRINEIVLGKRAISADTALRLSHFFGNSPQFWMGLQSQYDLDVAEDQLGKRLDREVRPYVMAG